MYKEQLQNDFKAVIKSLTSQRKDRDVIDKNHKEYVNMDRFIRPTQIGFTQVDKVVGKGNKSRTVIATRVAVNFQKEIVKKSVAFEVGEAPSINPTTQNELSDEVLNLWKQCRMDYKLQEVLEVKKSETESAFLFSFNTKSDGSRTIRTRILKHENGIMSPHFDEFGDMDAFVWEFTSKLGSKDVRNVWVYDEINVYKFSDAVGSFGFVEEIPHGFTRIPIVYMSQKFNEWKDVESIIDRYETSISKLVESNDYSGHPILALYGKITNMANKDDSGKTLNFPIETTDDGKPVHGDAKFITNNNAPEAVKLELETEKSLIYNITQTPNLSFESLKGLGAISGVALDLMFLDAELKAKGNEGENKTLIERCLNIFADGIVNIINVKLKSQMDALSWNIRFNSILPSDTTATIDDMAKGVESGIISIDTAVRKVGIVTDVDKELELIKENKDEKTTI